MPNEQQTVDFNKLRKRRQRLATLRRTFVLAAMVLALFGVITLNNLLVQESVTTRISDVVQSFGGSGYPVAAPGGLIRDVKASGDYLAVLNDANLYVYNNKGKPVGNFRQMNDSTVLLSTTGRLLTYNAGAKQYSIHSRSKTLLAQELEYEIIAAAINERGDYAIVSSSKQSICEVIVYNKRFENVYECLFAEKLVSTLSLSPKGTMMATGWINTVDGAMHSGVEIYRLSSDTVAAALELPDNLVLDIQFLEEDRIAVVTDRQYLVLGADGAVRYRYDFNGREMRGVELEGRQALLLLLDPDTRQRELVLLDNELNERAVYRTDERVQDIALAARRAYVLLEHSIETMDMQLETIATEEVAGANCIRLAGGRLYYLTGDEIRILGHSTGDDTDSDPLQAENPPDGTDPAGASPNGREADPASTDSGPEEEDV